MGPNDGVSKGDGQIERSARRQYTLWACNLTRENTKCSEIQYRCSAAEAGKFPKQLAQHAKRARVSKYIHCWPSDQTNTTRRSSFIRRVSFGIMVCILNVAKR